MESTSVEGQAGNTVNAGEPAAGAVCAGEPAADAANAEEPAARAAEPSAMSTTEPPAGAGGATEESGISAEDLETAATETLSMDELMAPDEVTESEEPAEASGAELNLKAVLEAVVYIADEPLTVAQMAIALNQPAERIDAALAELMAEFEKPEHGIAIREVAGGYKMATKAEHHDAVRSFVKSLKPPLKLSLPALETLAVIAYKQPVTGPEIMEIRGVQGGGVMKTLLDRKLIAVAGRKNVLGKPMLYKTTKEFLIQFGLKDLSELPSLKEFEEIRRMAFADSEPAAVAAEEAPEADAGESVETAEPIEAEAAAEVPSEPASEAAGEDESPAAESASEKHESES